MIAPHNGLWHGRYRGLSSPRYNTGQNQPKTNFLWPEPLFL